MKNIKSIDIQYLSELVHKIQTLPPDEAASVLIEVSTIFLFAGFPEIAYQGFLKLTQGELKISEESSLADPVKSIIPALCYFMKIPCPGIFSEQEMSISELEKHIIRTHPDDLIEIHNFLDELLENLTKGRVGSAVFLVAELPELMSRVSEGALQNSINLSQEQAQDFLDLINKRNYTPTSIGFIPTVDDWKKFLERWNEAIFNNLDEEHTNDCKFLFPDVLATKCCLKMSALEEEVSELEKRLGEKLPLSYRNFLLASNGFTILNYSCNLYGTDQIDWFIEDNGDWAEMWDDSDDDDDDEQYFQYGEHQDCIWMRGRYMKTALQISSTLDGCVYLLNPQIIDSRNEWEAWDFGSKYPGAYRYRSFWDMMQKVYRESLERTE